MIRLFFLLLIPINAFAGPSFSCSKAGTKIEHSICDYGELSEYDNLMDRMYQELKSKPEVKKSQRKWLKMRDKQCSSGDFDCLSKLYSSRLLELDKYFPQNSNKGNYELSGYRDITLSIDGNYIKLSGSGGGQATCSAEGIG